MLKLPMTIFFKIIDGSIHKLKVNDKITVLHYFPSKLKAPKKIPIQIKTDQSLLKKFM